MTLILIEGPPSSGKTILARMLKPDNIVRHEPYIYERNMHHRYVKELKNIARHPDELTIFDLSWWSDKIYGLMLDGRDPIGIQSRILDRIALGLGATMIICLPAFQDVLYNYEVRYECGRSIRWVYERLKIIYDEYNNDPSALPTVSYDYNRSTPPMVRRKILGKMVRNTGPGIGMFKKGVTLLVGDHRSSDRYSDELEWPFAGDQGCGEWFAQKLDELQISEKDLYWVNAFNFNGVPINWSFVDRLKPSCIVALGKAADAALEVAKLDHYAVDHPQHQKRFHYAERWKDLEDIFS